MDERRIIYSFLFSHFSIYAKNEVDFMDIRKQNNCIICLMDNVVKYANTYT